MMPGSVLLQLNYYHRMIMICNPYFNLLLIYFSIFLNVEQFFVHDLQWPSYYFCFFKKSMLENNNILVFSLCLDYVNYYFWTALYTQLLCVSIFFLQLQKPVERQVMCVSYSFLHGVFLSKFTSLKKASERQ